MRAHNACPAQMAKALLTWTVPYSTVFSGSLEHGDVAWFGDGYLNACVNCVDRHASLHPDRVAIIYEADEPGHAKRVTYAELMRDVCRLANALRDMGVRKGHPVAIYMPMVPQVAVAMLACARIGAVHTVVFAGFSADSLAERVSDAGCRVLITANEGMRGGKVIPIKKIVDTALLRCPSVQVGRWRVLPPLSPGTAHPCAHSIASCSVARTRSRPPCRIATLTGTSAW